MELNLINPSYLSLLYVPRGLKLKKNSSFLPTYCIYVFLCGSQNKKRLFPYTTLTDWFL
jgi:hypothetical protein